MLRLLFLSIPSLFSNPFPVAPSPKVSGGNTPSQLQASATHPFSLKRPETLDGAFKNSAFGFTFFLIENLSVAD